MAKTLALVPCGVNYVVTNIVKPPDVDRPHREAAARAADLKNPT